DTKIQITSTGPLTLRTSSAEFHFSPNGSLQASLLRGKETLTLDDPQGARSGSALTIAGNEVSDFTFDIEHARSSPASGRLGSDGKPIEISGKSSSTPGLQSTAWLEVYDTFPNVVLTSISFKNTGNADISIDKVITQRHSFNASLSDPKAPPYSMWSFHGS